MSHASINMNDYNEIRLPEKPFSPRLTTKDTSLWHKLEKQFIEEELAHPFDGKKVVITHHTPSKRCLPEHEQEDLLSAAYANHLDDLIELYQPATWIYGHVHEEQRIQIGETTVCRYARGYPHLIREKPTFYKPKIITVD